jgi:hypothetical protein
MNARRLMMVAVVLSVGSVTLGGAARAQEAVGLRRSAHVNCYKVVGEARDTWPGAGNVSTGVIASFGLLNGATQYVYDTEGFPTPDPNVVTFGAGLTVTTKHGTVGGRVLFLFDVVTGTWTSIATVDPKSSTGRFAGATGTLWFPSGTTINLDGGAQSYPSYLTGHLCLAR